MKEEACRACSFTRLFQVDEKLKQLEDLLGERVSDKLGRGSACAKRLVCSEEVHENLRVLDKQAHLKVQLFQIAQVDFGVEFKKPKCVQQVSVALLHKTGE